MRKLIATTFLAALFVSPLALAQDRQLDPIFEYTPVSGQPDQGCFDNRYDDRNVLVRGATSMAGQTIIGGLIGAAIGNQIGGGSGKDIATGIGVALGASAGAYNAQRQRDARIRECQQYQGYANNYRGQPQAAVSRGGYSNYGNNNNAYRDTASHVPVSGGYGTPSDYDRLTSGR